MYDLQAALDAQLASLKGKKSKASKITKKNVTSKTYIKRSLTEAGILNEKGKMVHKVTTG